MRSTKPIRSGDGSRSLPLVTAGPERRERLSIYAKSRVRCEWFRPQPPSTLAAPISCRPPRWVQTSGAGALRSNAADLLLFLEAFGDPNSPIGAIVQPLITPRAQGGMELGPL